MPVNVLYCEGGPKSPDIRVLAALLNGVCVVRPAGGKYGFGQRIRLAREFTPASVVAGLRDRDLEEEAREPECLPGGQRFQHFWSFFAGKDLLCAMEGALTVFGLGTPFEFRERVLKGLEESTGNPWTWLPEWHKLRELVSRTASNGGP